MRDYEKRLQKLEGRVDACLIFNREIIAEMARALRTLDTRVREALDPFAAPRDPKEEGPDDTRSAAMRAVAKEYLAALDDDEDRGDWTG